MASQIHDPDALEQLLAQLRSVHDALEEATSAIDAYDAAIGSRRVEDALNAFTHGWTDGRRKILDALGATIDRLDAAIGDYRSVEDEIIASAAHNARP